MKDYNKQGVATSGFTLIEMSIVLVIIGLIIGGILTGQDLISAAAQRAQIAQVEKYNTAVRAFQNKYGGLPGDLPNPYASQFGLATRGSNRGQGDGNGILETQNNTYWCGCFEGGGETTVFWVDLSTAGLIDGNFNTATESGFPSSTSPAVYFPPGKLGQGNYVLAWGGGPSGNEVTSSSAISGDGLNYFAVSAPSSIYEIAYGVYNAPGMTVLQAYNMDKKVDDGLPQSGGVIAAYPSFNVGANGESAYWVGGVSGTPAYTSQTAGTTTSCFDNSATSSGTPGVSGAAQHYSLEMSGGRGTNCALSFRFQ